VAPGRSGEDYRRFPERRSGPQDRPFTFAISQLHSCFLRGSCAPYFRSFGDIVGDSKSCRLCGQLREAATSCFAARWLLGDHDAPTGSRPKHFPRSASMHRISIES